MRVKDLFESLNENDRRKVVTMMRRLNESASEERCPKWLEDMIKENVPGEADDFYEFDDLRWCAEQLENINRKSDEYVEDFLNSIENTSLKNYTPDFTYIFDGCGFKNNGIKIEIENSDEDRDNIVKLISGTKSLQDYTDRIAKFYADKIYKTISM